MVVVDCQMNGCESRLYHVCLGEYVAMHEIDLDGAEQKICHNCVEEIWMGGKPEKLKKVQHSTVYRTDELDEEEEELEGTVHLDGVDEFSIVTFIYPCGTVIVSSLGYFSSNGSSSKLSHPYLPFSLSEHATFKSISRRRRGGKEN